MSKISRDPILFDEMLKLTIADLKRMSLLIVPNDAKFKSEIKWTNKKTDTVVSSINIEVDTSKFLFNYRYRGQLKCYYVDKIIESSNLGNGFVYYFKCPLSHLKCRVLYLHNGIFCHRSACKGALYGKQKESKKGRELFKLLNKTFGKSDLYKQILAKYRKKYYKDKPTKWFGLLKNKIDKKERISFDDIRRYL